ncbi:unnamed protein product [Diamesa serratosioi]
MDSSTKVVIRSILLAYGKPCSLVEFSKLYLEFAGERLNFSKSGFASLEKCLLGMPDVCKLRYFCGEWYVERVATAETEHLELLTKAISKKSVPKRNSNYGPPAMQRNYMNSMIYNRSLKQPVNGNFYNPIQRCYPKQNRPSVDNHKPFNTYNRDVPTHVFNSTSYNYKTNNNIVVTFNNDVRSVADQNNYVPYSKTNNSIQPPTSSSQRPSFVIPKPKMVSAPAYPVTTPKTVYKRNVPTLVFKDTVEPTKEIKTPSVDKKSFLTENVEDKTSFVSTNSISRQTSSTPSLKSHMSKNSLERINLKPDTYALINSALNDIKIQKKKDAIKDDIPDISSLNLNNVTKISIQSKPPNFSDLEKEITSLLPDDPIYLIEFPEIIQDCTYKIPDPIINETKAVFTFEIYISEVQSPTQFWFQYGEEDLEDLMYEMNLLKKNDLSISARNTKPGLVVAAFILNKWHRAEILSEVDERNQILVFFFDFGTKDKVDLKNIKYLLETFSKMPRKALRGSLHGIKPKNNDTMWNLKTSFFLLQRIEDKRLFAKVVNHREKDNVFELVVKESLDETCSLNDSLIEENYADFAPSSKLINGILNKRYQDGEFEEISYKRDSPLIWRSLKEFNLTDSKEICKNSKQGPKFIVDERGFVCELSDLLTTGCCDIDSEKTKLYQCESCNAANCCQIYEYCVSCCNNPDKVPMLEKLIAKANDRQSLLFSSISDQFSLCLSLCRTNSNIDKCRSFGIEFHLDTNINKFQIGE